MFIIRRKLFTTDIPSVIELSRRGERKGTELLYYGKKKKNCVPLLQIAKEHMGLLSAYNLGILP